MADQGDAGIAEEEKIALFLLLTSIDDPQVAREILSANSWDLYRAFSIIYVNPLNSATSITTSYAAAGYPAPSTSCPPSPVNPCQPKDAAIPTPLSPCREAVEFGRSFLLEHGSFGDCVPQFVTMGFDDALELSRLQCRPLFVYLHHTVDPDDPDNPEWPCNVEVLEFCQLLCDDQLARFLYENFVCWGGNIWQPEGSRMRNRLNAKRFPFWAVALAEDGEGGFRILRQIDVPKGLLEVIQILREVLRETRRKASTLQVALLESAKRRSNILLREEQDAAYRRALEADRAVERRRKEEQEQLEIEAKKKAAIARRKQEKATSLGIEPEEGPDVTTVRVRFPNGLSKARRFHKSATILSLYDFVDSLDCLDSEKYSLFSRVPPVTYGPDEHSLTLEEAGLHRRPHTLFIKYG